ncbi:hypothetical protein C451_02450 [Halococcus thailandensis JCM 13552]|uniref:Uncharacterized protein n=1 Tax=Halococcus thailandensis JCM 13552 TaxID=1227457 RepID=M0NFV0_9EURY|nr:hypothetical protein C451_02450 [Halococcus thailandensis JCM 13552]
MFLYKLDLIWQLQTSLSAYIDHLRIVFTPLQVAIGLVLVVPGFTLLFMLESVIHGLLHNFRHTVGVTRH